MLGMPFHDSLYLSESLAVKNLVHSFQKKLFDSVLNVIMINIHHVYINDKNRYFIK